MVGATSHPSLGSLQVEEEVPHRVAEAVLRWAVEVNRLQKCSIEAHRVGEASLHPGEEANDSPQEEENLIKFT